MIPSNRRFPGTQRNGRGAGRRRIACLVAAALLAAPAAWGQTGAGAQGGEWRYYGGDEASTRYSPLDQIDRDNFEELELVWRLKTDNFGPEPEYNFQSTPLMVGGVVYTTAGTRRAVVAADAATGEYLWMHRLDEGERAEVSPRRRSGRGLSWRDDGGDGQIIYVTPGYRMVALNAKTGQRIAGFGDDGIVDLMQNMDQEIDPLGGSIGLHSTPLVAGDTIVIGAAHVPGSAPVSMRNTKGYVRGFDADTGERKWIFHTLPGADEFGNDTWLNDSWRYTGNTGVWGQTSVDLELGIVYLATEMPTNDYYGGHRHGDNLFSDSIVAVDLETGDRLWHFQAIHHDVWDWDFPCAPILADVVIDGVERKIVAQPSKQAWLYVLDRETGEPIWPIEERPMEQSDVPGELLAATQPFPTRPAPYDRQGVGVEDLIDFTPELHAEALARVANFRMGPIFTPPVVADPDGPYGTLMLPSAGGRHQLAGRLPRPRDRHLLRVLVHQRDLARARERSRAVGHGLHPRQPGRGGAARPGPDHPRAAPRQAAVGPHHRHRPEDRRPPLADPARRDPRQRPQPPGPAGGRDSPHRPRRPGRHPHHEDAGHRGRAGHVHHALGRGRRDAAGLRQDDRRGGRRGADAGRGVGVADDLHARRGAVHRRRGQRRRAGRRAAGVPAAGLTAGAFMRVPATRREALPRAPRVS